MNNFPIPKKPPVIAERILKRIINDERESPAGDFEEYYNYLATDSNRIAAVSWYLYQILVLAAERIINSILRSTAMIKNYLKIAIRNLKKYKVYSFINITGLVAGITCFIIIQLWIRYELSYDKYHERAGQTYRIATDSKFNDNVIASASTPAIIAKTLIDEYADVLEAVRIQRFSTLLVKLDEDSFLENGVFAADNSLLRVFSFNLIEGDSETALKEPYSVIITEKIADKYFSDQNPINKVLNIQDVDYRVTGILEEIKPNTHFHAEIIISGSSIDQFESESWWYQAVKTYIVLKKEIPYREFKALDELVFNYRNPGRINTADIYWKWYLQPITDIHLHSKLSGEFEPNGNITYIYLFSSISVIILLLACFNFINLTTARSSSRNKEISIRKVTGSHRSQLMFQFLSETAIISAVSTIISIAVVKSVLSWLNSFLGKQLSFSLSDPQIMISIFCFIVVLSLLSGIYPALILSSLKPMLLLKGSSSGKSSSVIRYGLVLFQFSISIILIIGVLTVCRQLNFISSQQLGFNKEQVVLIQNANLLGGSVDIFKKELLKDPSIVKVSISNTVPGRYYDGRGVDYEPGKEVLLDLGRADEDFSETLGIDLVAGRFFSKEIPSDTMAIVINESALNYTGWDDPLGKIMEVKGIGYYRVIGVMKDHHYESKHQKIWPMALLSIHQRAFPARYVSAKINTGDVAGTLQMIEDSWKMFSPGAPFSFTFLDEDYYRLYRSEEKTAEMFSIFSILALLIGSLGLFGLASYVVEKRAREVGIRKAIGANEGAILYSLMNQFIIWPISAIIFAWPAGWYLMDWWLQSFEYRIHLEINIFLLSGLAVILTAVISVVIQSLKAAYKNPVESLRYE